MKIFLIGFMGCGKSRLGKSTAHQYHFNFIDLDDLIEVNHQQTISQIFATIGEQAFREIEKDSLQNSAFGDNTIISTGGGAPCYFDNMKWMNANGITVFIDSPVKVLADRLIKAKVERPLIKGMSLDQLIEFISEKLNQRRPFYEQAHITIRGVDLNPKILMDEIESYKIQIK